LQGDEKTITTNIAAQIRESLANIRLITTNMTTATAALNDDELTRLIANWRRFGILYKEGTKSAGPGRPQEYIFGAASPTNTQPKQSP